MSAEALVNDILSLPTDHAHADHNMVDEHSEDSGRSYQPVLDASPLSPLPERTNTGMDLPPRYGEIPGEID